MLPKVGSSVYIYIFFKYSEFSLLKCVKVIQSINVLAIYITIISIFQE